jgi:hypothetical protein
MVHKIKRKKISEEEVLELTDIFQDFNDKNVAKNIEYLLRRHKLWSPKYKIVFPVGGLDIHNKDEDFYQKDFEVFSSHNKIALIGTAYGVVQMDEIIDMNVELKRTG